MPVNQIKFEILLELIALAELTEFPREYTSSIPRNYWSQSLSDNFLKEKLGEEALKKIKALFDLNKEYKIENTFSKNIIKDKIASFLGKKPTKKFPTLKQLAIESVHTYRKNKKIAFELTSKNLPAEILDELNELNMSTPTKPEILLLNDRWIPLILMCGTENANCTLDSMFAANDFINPALSFLHLLAKINNTALLIKYIKNTDVLLTLDSFNTTPLHIACFKGNETIVKIMLNMLSCDNAIITQPTKNTGDTALHFACYKSSLSIVQLLIEKGAIENFFNHSGLTPLACAYLSGNVPVIQYLESKNALFAAPFGFTREDLTYLTGNIETLQLLVKEGYSSQKPGKTEINTAAISDLILSQPKNYYHICPLHLACLTINTPMVAMLLINGALEDNGWKFNPEQLNKCLKLGNFFDPDEIDKKCQYQQIDFYPQKNTLEIILKKISALLPDEAKKIRCLLELQRAVKAIMNNNEKKTISHLENALKYHLATADQFFEHFRDSPVFSLSKTSKNNFDQCTKHARESIKPTLLNKLKK